MSPVLDSILLSKVCHSHWGRLRDSPISGYQNLQSLFFATTVCPHHQLTIIKRVNNVTPRYLLKTNENLYLLKMYTQNNPYFQFLKQQIKVEVI